MQISARNQISGTITNIEKGAVTALVTIEIATGAEITASITNASVDKLGLAVGKQAYAVVKASDVLVAVED